MSIDIVQPDPLQVLTSTKPIVETLQDLVIIEETIGDISRTVRKYLMQGLHSAQENIIPELSFEDNIQLIFIEDAVNFCFWSEKDKPKWTVIDEEGKNWTGGWYSLVKCFKRCFRNNIPVLDANFLKNISLSRTEEIFKGNNETKIPLVEKRMENLKEAGRVLEVKYQGKFINALEASNYDAIELVNIIRQDFSSFNDMVLWNNKPVYFLKRAQLCAQEISRVVRKFKNTGMKNLDVLTAFADYKLPQMLRKFGVIQYKKDLAEKIDSYDLIQKNSREEMEIRAATIWCVELIRQELEKYNAAEIDYALWLLSQDQSDIKPYHRTYTIFY